MISSKFFGGSIFAVALLIAAGNSPLKAGPEDNEVVGQIQYADGSNDESESPEFVVKNGDREWFIVVRDRRIVSMLKQGVGRWVSVKGKVKARELEDGSESQEIVLEQLVSRPDLAPEMADAIAKREKAERKKYLESQKPLPDEEEIAARDFFGEDSPYVGGDLKLRHELKVRRIGSNETLWVVQPDGKFSRYNLLPEFEGRGGKKLTEMETGKGQLSLRQLTSLAKTMQDANLLELREELSPETESDDDSERRQTYEVSFGEANIAFQMAYRKPEGAEEGETSHRRLGLFILRFNQQVHANLKFQSDTSDSKKSPAKK